MVCVRRRDSEKQSVSTTDTNVIAVCVLVRKFRTDIVVRKRWSRNRDHFFFLFCSYLPIGFFFFNFNYPIEQKPANMRNWSANNRKHRRTTHARCHNSALYRIKSNWSRYPHFTAWARITYAQCQKSISRTDYLNWLSKHCVILTKRPNGTNQKNFIWAKNAKQNIVLYGICILGHWCRRNGLHSWQLRKPKRSK